MLRGIVLGLSLTLAAALQLVATPSASADGGLLGGLAEVVTPGGDAADAPTEPDEPGLLGGLLDTVDEVTEPLTGDLLDPITDTLDSSTGDLDTSLSESLDQTIVGLTETLIEVGLVATALQPSTPAPNASGAPAATPLNDAATILNEVLEPIAPHAADTITAATEPPQLLVGEQEPVTPALLPLIPAIETLGPVISVLQPILEPALRLTSAVVRPIVMLVEPVVTPVLRSLERLLQPVAGLLRPVVDVPPLPAPVIEPAPAAEPPPPRAAWTAGHPSFKQGDLTALAPGLVRTTVLLATAGLQVLEMPGAQVSGANAVVVAPSRLLEGVLVGAMDEPGRAAAEHNSPSILVLSSSGPGEKDSSSKFQPPFAAIPQYFVLLVAGYLLFALTYGARSQSWLKCPVRPPI